MGVDVLTTFERSMKTVMEWIHQEVNTENTHVFFRSYAPIHIRFVSCLSPSIVHFRFVSCLSPSIVHFSFLSCLSPSIDWINLYKLEYLALMVEYHKKIEC